MKRWVIWFCALTLFLFSPIPESRADTVLYTTITEGALNVREAPWGDKIGWLEPGESVTYIDDKDGWTLVACGVEAGEGWVKSEYLTTDLEAAGEYQNSTGGRVRIRETPGGKHLKWLKAGNIVTVMSWMVDGAGGEWGYIGDGYVSKDCLTKVVE